MQQQCPVKVCSEQSEIQAVTQRKIIASDFTMRGVGKRLVDKSTVGNVFFGSFCFDNANETAADFQGVVGVVRSGLFFTAGLNLNGFFENDIFGGVAQFF